MKAFDESSLASTLSYSRWEIISAQQQVVAGINYFLEIAQFDDSGNCINHHTAVVYDRFGDVAVTSSENMPCVKSAKEPEVK